MRLTFRFASYGIMAALLAACGGSDVASNNNSHTAALRTGASGPTAPSVPSAHVLLVQNMYLAYFGRAPDSEGLAFWTGAFDAFGMPSTAAELFAAYASQPNAKWLVDGFLSGPEGQALNNGSNADFVNTVYMNIFGRYAEAGGLEYWTRRLNFHEITRQLLVLTIMAGAQADDQLAMAKKNEVVTRYLAALVAAGVKNGVPLSIVGRDLPTKVNKDTDLAAFQASIDAAVRAQRLETAPTHTLRYSGFQSAYSNVTTNVLYRYSNGSGIVPVFAGKLTFGLGEREIGFGQVPGQVGPVVYDAPVSASVSVADNSDGSAPTLLMLCQTPAGSTQSKTADILVLNSAQLLSDASQLAGQSFNFNRQDCAQGDGTLTVDANGLLRIETPGESWGFASPDVNRGLTGQMSVLTMGGLPAPLSWRAYRYVKSDGTIKYAVVQTLMTTNPATLKTTSVLTLWSQE